MNDLSGMDHPLLTGAVDRGDPSTFDLVFNVTFFFVVLCSLSLYVIYFMATYANPDETNIGKSFISKFIVYLGFMLAFMPIMLV